MCRSEKGYAKVLKEFYMQKILGEYWTGSGAGIEVM